MLTFQLEAAVAVTVTGLEVTDGALAAEIVPWLVAVVPGGVPGGNFTTMPTWAIVPGSIGSNIVNVAVRVAAS